MRDIDKAVEESRRPPSTDSSGRKMPDIGKIIDEAKSCLLPFESWEQLPGETGRAYAAFCAYRDFGPERSIRKAVEKHETGAVKQGKRYRMWLSWSMQFKWVKRTEDYDRYLDRLKQAELRKTIETRGEAHREVTKKMLQVVNKKLDMMNPADLSQGTVTEWVETAVKTEREIFGLTAGKEKAEAGKPGNIAFTPEFEGI